MSPAGLVDHVFIASDTESEKRASTVLSDFHRLEHDLAARIRELEPLVEEYRQLRQLAKRLGIAVGDATPRRVLAKPGQRREQVLARVTAQPGVTIREISREMGVDPTSLYRPVRQLEAEGAIRKEGPRLHPA
jgi:sugar-specific transcriptional regulator TrmB